MKIKINPRYCLKTLLVCISFLFIANCIGLISKLYYNNSETVFIKLFDFDYENNFPTFYATITLFLSSLLLGLIAFCTKKHYQKNYLFWLGLSFCFLFLAIDESVQIHERIGAVLSRRFNFSGVLYYAWIIPYCIVLFVLASLYYFKFLRYLPKKIMWLLLFSGLLFILGAVGFEMLGAKEASSLHTSEFRISIFYTLEELLEMLGIALFIYTLLLYLKEEVLITIKKNSFNN